MKTQIKNINSFTKELDVQVDWDMLKDGRKEKHDMKEKVQDM